MKKIIQATMLALLLGSCTTARPSTGSYKVISAQKQNGGTRAKLHGIRHHLFFPTDTLKAGDSVKLIVIGRAKD